MDKQEINKELAHFVGKTITQAYMTDEGYMFVHVKETPESCIVAKLAKE